MKKGKIKSFLLDLLFPKFCFNCKGEGSFLCEDCKAILDISNSHHPPSRFSGGLNDLYWAVEYKNPLIKNLIKCFKYEPLVKELAKDLTSLIIAHFQLLDPPPNFGGGDYVLLPVPLEKRKLKWRGFNQAEELAKELSSFLPAHLASPTRNTVSTVGWQGEAGGKIPLISDCLIKIKENLPQVELSEGERKENIKGVFIIEKPEKIRGRKILLVDDVYTTGSTMKECAQLLKKAGAKEVIGIVIARAAPGQDQFKNVQ